MTYTDILWKRVNAFERRLLDEMLELQSRPTRRRRVRARHTLTLQRRHRRMLKAEARRQGPS